MKKISGIILATIMLTGCTKNTQELKKRGEISLSQGQSIKYVFLGQEVPQDEIRSRDGGFYIPIESLEPLLDAFDFSTSNYKSSLYTNHDGDLCVYASIELTMFITSVRTFSGACNFRLKDLEPNTHWNATAKSECIKNAASDAGRRLGRGLNMQSTELPEIQQKKIKKSVPPDGSILNKYREAKASKADKVKKAKEIKVKSKEQEKVSE